MASVVSVLAAYLIGCISFAILASWLFRLPDPRSYGSGNPGATNVLRSGKKAAALFTLVGDALKGWIAVALAIRLASRLGFGEETIAACAVAVFLGHLYPIYFGFKGGKGVATALGVVLGLDAWIALAAVLAFVVTAGVSRYVSLASIAAAVTATVAAVVSMGWTSYAQAIMLLAVFITWRHRANIQRLVNGTERKLRAPRTESPPPDTAG
jgi:glycerol-3-phosphate acyltransferase PlsY